MKRSTYILFHVIIAGFCIAKIAVSAENSEENSKPKFGYSHSRFTSEEDSYTLFDNYDFSSDFDKNETIYSSPLNLTIKKISGITLPIASLLSSINPLLFDLPPPSIV